MRKRRLSDRTLLNFTLKVGIFFLVLCLKNKEHAHTLNTSLNWCMTTLTMMRSMHTSPQVCLVLKLLKLYLNSMSRLELVLCCCSGIYSRNNKAKAARLRSVSLLQFNTLQTPAKVPRIILASHRQGGRRQRH